MNSQFCGSFRNNVMAIAAFLMMIIVSLISGGSPSMAVHLEDQSFDLWSRDEMIRMAGYGEEKLSKVVVSGSVVCEACPHGDAQLHAWPVPGAMVAVKCHTNNKKHAPTSWTQGITDEYGDLAIDLPSHIHANTDLHKKCSIKLVRLPKNSPCRPIHVKKRKAMTFLSLDDNGVRTYTMGKMRLVDSTSKSSPLCSSTLRKDTSI